MLFVLLLLWFVCVGLSWFSVCCLCVVCLDGVRLVVLLLFARCCPRVLCVCVGVVCGCMLLFVLVLRVLFLLYVMFVGCCLVVLKLLV